MSIPEAQAIGRIHGRDFRLDTATIEEGRLWLQQGKDRCDLAVDIPLCLKNGEFLDDKTIQVSPALTGENLVHIFWKSVDNPGGPISMTLGDYALRMEFGKLQQGVISGKIFVCLPDDDHSFVAGKFSVGGPGDAGLRWSEISGRVKILDNGEKHVINVACLGKSPTGQLEVPSTGLELPPEFTGTKCSSWKPRDTSLSCGQADWSHTQTRQSPGRALFDLLARTLSKRAGWLLGFLLGQFERRSLEGRREPDIGFQKTRDTQSFGSQGKGPVVGQESYVPAARSRGPPSIGRSPSIHEFAHRPGPGRWKGNDRAPARKDATRSHSAKLSPRRLLWLGARRKSSWSLLNAAPLRSQSAASSLESTRLCDCKAAVRFPFAPDSKSRRCMTARS